MFSSLNPIPFSSSPAHPCGVPVLPSQMHPQPALPEPAVPQLAAGAVQPGFDELFMKSPLPMWIFDRQSLWFLAVNAAAEEKYGHRREEFLAMTADKICAPAEVHRFRDWCHGAATAERVPQCWHHISANGPMDVSASWQLLTFEGREAILMTLTDRSGQSRAEAENRDFAQVLNLATDAIIVCNLDRQVLFWNTGAERIYGWNADEAVGRQVHELFNLNADLVLKCMSGLIEKGEWSGELRNACKSGREAVVDSRWTLARDEETKQPKNILLINSDVTEKKQLELQFLRTQRLESIGTLASGIAHDLNNILSPIMMAVGILKGTAVAGDQKMLGIIEASAERGAGIVKQVLTFARGAEGERILLQPKHVATEMVKVMVQTFPKNVDIQSYFPQDLWLVNGDATQLHQVLLNLCVNARDAMGEKGGALRVTAENIEVDEHLANTNPGAQLGPHVCFSVTDTGSGMTPEVMEKIFDPFFTTKEHGKGTGLGLATVIGIVKGHKGFLTLQSQIGIGTTFKVFIPADREAKTEIKKSASSAELRGNGELVLVVDDEAQVREAIVRTLEAHNYRCYTAEDGTDALALYFERREIHVVITDLHMGMMDGITLVRSLRKLNPEVRCIVSSGHINKDNQDTLGGLGVKWFLEKPYTAEKLLRCVKASLPPPVPDAKAA